MTNYNNCSDEATFEILRNRQTGLSDIKSSCGAGYSPGSVTYTFYHENVFPIEVIFNDTDHRVVTETNPTVTFDFNCDINSWPSTPHVGELTFPVKTINALGCERSWEFTGTCSSNLRVTHTEPALYQECYFPDPISFTQISGGVPPYEVSATILESWGEPSNFPAGSHGDPLVWTRTLNNLSLIHI